MVSKPFPTRLVSGQLRAMAVLVSPPDLARTYNPQSYEDAWETVEDYQRILEYTGRHPNKGSSAVASNFNLPRGRVHPWMNGSRPAPVRAIQIAEEHEWLPLSTDDGLFPSFNRLVAWIFSRGSISEAEYAPMFTCHHEDERERLTGIFDTLDINYTWYHEESTDRATEARISEHRTIVGRLLFLLGAPLGPREDATTLPTYLTPPSSAESEESMTTNEVRSHARTFAETYLANTAQYWAWEDGFVVRHEDRSAEYLQSLARIFEFAADDSPVEVNPDSLFLASSLAKDLCSPLTKKMDTETTKPTEQV